MKRLNIKLIKRVILFFVTYLLIGHLILSLVIASQGFFTGWDNFFHNFIFGLLHHFPSGSSYSDILYLKTLLTWPFYLILYWIDVRTHMNLIDVFY
ncbi:hypothetical protein A3B45_05425 [Candidatus Daviesbacteria bacterium RIFCSPLOWO2_01_FULL_39_12]|uniref:Uncharacterized protein n=1 Tax=Candidatus Daviesbacteria bacterium RIFCSPLOWO2_01_FULL_39_12 TaxID=1797785 RepID=A0A1F5KTN0_9BACT|nr:MAG: hypothetical protein A3D79_03485 [Candidatus Daviesbacteria bacterium RIFCSPHIGHO2_02_FULL_39_8]OGE44189.1 MAG: hypothetical protein A3B45_05425 [Candidatus Daviesbacteria bacterium RIFCSPLOWO2_01_FULL_39_12]